MSQQNLAASGYFVFEYMYRDAGNWKTHGALLLIGDAESAHESLEEYFEWGGLFVAEQIGVPSLCVEHFSACGVGPSDLDHAYHEFAGLRPATAEDVVAMPVAGALSDMLMRVRTAAGRWDITLSPICYL